MTLKKFKEYKKSDNRGYVCEPERVNAHFDCLPEQIKFSS